jgi:hypothetical protein
LGMISYFYQNKSAKLSRIRFLFNSLSQKNDFGFT